MASTAEIIPFRAPTIKELVFDLQEAQCARAGLYRQVPGRDPSDREDAAISDAGATVTAKSNFTALAKRNWLKRFDHNHLRISRIIRYITM